jgi:hypothetical protein
MIKTNWVVGLIVRLGRTADWASEKIWLGVCNGTGRLEKEYWRDKIKKKKEIKTGKNFCMVEN